MSKIQNVHIPAAQKNFAINGACDFFQEKGAAVSTVNTAATVGAWSADMISYGSQGPTNKNYSLQQGTNVPTFAQCGFKVTNAIRFTMITGIPSFASSDLVSPFQYKVEGLDYQKLHGRVVTFGFWAYASVTGTYSFALRNASSNRSYVTTFTINSPNTYEFKSITVQLDSSGTWNFDTSIGLFVDIASGTGSALQTASLNSWQSGSFLGASTATNWMATSGAILDITLFSIVEGSLGFGPTGFQRCGQDIEDEFAMCERYFEVVSGYVGSAESTTMIGITGPFRTSKRVSPSSMVRLSAAAATIRHQANDFTAATPTFSNTTTLATTFWVNVSGFTGLTTGALAYDRSTSRWLAADARL